MPKDRFLLVLHFLSDLVCFTDIILYLCNTIKLVVVQR
nr:MAG TPA: hypothetical protein [Caudoviricetes sp.]